ncbi:MAG: lipoyl synthase [candidate division WOR-3 bacterium]|nr:lipoyl synthase [candidate division WOR-3 bacterium]MCX7837495.1 lipoyl synthase [candidate division WOR-3 bacterium]MDW8113398.1 lipoyl synthase [candidate division WOR-3 bacterium]
MDSYFAKISSLPGGKEYSFLKNILKKYNLNTVCENAKCPNLGECFNKKSLTFMILGNVCTRKCLFCGVKQGIPNKVLEDEPEKIALAVKELSLSYCVITSVTRDDLIDYGAGIFAQTIEKIKEILPNILIEVLIPDFMGDLRALKEVVLKRPNVLAHNIETTKRLTKIIRDKKADYYRSLWILKKTKEIDKEIITKSGIMVGLGEEEEEIYETLLDLKGAGVDIVTIGQYLMPSRGSYPVKKYYKEEDFKRFAEFGKKIGIRKVISGIKVRSSYLAEVYFH